MGEQRTDARPSGSALAVLQLLRLPTVFTAMADVVLGFVLTHRTLEPLAQFLGLLGASSCLYLAGMVFNDVFDRRVDTEERPGRPIPSGRVTVRSAALLGGGLIACGLVLAGIVGRQSFFVALLLTGCILAYDGGLKRTPLGPLAMGACRFLNVILGASAVDVWWYVWINPQRTFALGLGLYIVGVTWFARTEARVSSRMQLGLATAVVNLGIGVLVWFAWTWRGEAEIGGVLAFLAVIALIVNRRLAVALPNPVPERVGPAIKTMLLSIIMLDAAVVFLHTNNPPLALGTAALVIPALLLARLIPMT